MSKECPICMEEICDEINKVTTDCGHIFHCKCLIQNVAHNGFNCPYCRNVLADEPNESVETDTTSGFHNVEEENMLTSFRMFHQRINNEEVEHDRLRYHGFDDEYEEDDSVNEFINENNKLAPNFEYVCDKLKQQNISYEDLVKALLYENHHNWGTRYVEHSNISNEISHRMQRIIDNYGDEAQQLIPNYLFN